MTAKEHLIKLRREVRALRRAINELIEAENERRNTETVSFERIKELQGRGTWSTETR